MRTSPTKGWPAIIWNDMQIINCSSALWNDWWGHVFHQKEGKQPKVYTTVTWRQTVKQWTVERKNVSLWSMKDTQHQEHTDRMRHIMQPWITFMFVSSCLIEGWRGYERVAMERVSIKELLYAKVAFICFPVGMKCFYFRENCPEP